MLEWAQELVSAWERMYRSGGSSICICRSNSLDALSTCSQACTQDTQIDRHRHSQYPTLLLLSLCRGKSQAKAMRSERMWETARVLEWVLGLDSQWSAQV